MIEAWADEPPKGLTAKSWLPTLLALQAKPGVWGRVEDGCDEQRTNTVSTGLRNHGCKVKRVRTGIGEYEMWACWENDG